METGLEVRVPLCDHRLRVRLQRPPGLKTFDGREKSLLRHATKDLLPAPIVQRRKAPRPSTQDLGQDRAVNREPTRIAADPGPEEAQPVAARTSGSTCSPPARRSRRAATARVQPESV
ncbi:asparagine synthase-related protein [Streptomyces sp. NPDC000927]|uniref:asparagine synthase-related protein n=1 Tax=unclassified Streptomyces TaxID=2593676 RepID=UPI00332C4917